MGTIVSLWRYDAAAAYTIRPDGRSAVKARAARDRLRRLAALTALRWPRLFCFHAFMACSARSRSASRKIVKWRGVARHGPWR